MEIFRVLALTIKIGLPDLCGEVEILFLMYFMDQFSPWNISEMESLWLFRRHINAISVYSICLCINISILSIWYILPINCKTIELLALL